MGLSDKEITLLTRDQVFGSKPIDVIQVYGAKCAVTDLAILSGAAVDENSYIKNDTTLKGRCGFYSLANKDADNNPSAVSSVGTDFFAAAGDYSYCLRPVIHYDNINELPTNGIKNEYGFLEIEYGKFPQYASSNTEKLTKVLMNDSSMKIDKSYTLPSGYSYAHILEEHAVYEYNGLQYIIYFASQKHKNITLSNEYKGGSHNFIEISPLKWIVDEEAKMLICKNLIVAGIKFCDTNTYDGDFTKTEVYDWLNNYFAKEIIQDNTKEMIQGQLDTDKKQSNPYGFNLDQVSEEEIIKGAIESDVAVLLHGASGEGKSARVKQIDPDYTILYARNVTPESLNGKSVYNSNTEEMMNIKPTWLKKLEEKCKNEPNKYHILFLDEITNAPPSLQGMIFNIVLDKEVNGMWKLPDNVRIVAAGNDMEDSLAANTMAEPLFNRFAHVYIETTVEKWLKWASDNNIHPAIYAYIAYKKESALRSKYNGEKPNADPRKWEMASKMLYKTGSPEMLRALVGDEITKEFCQFCRQRVITLEDVLNNNYTDADLNMNTSEIYATAMGLSQVDENNFSIVREFVAKLGAEPCAMFESMWARGYENRLEIIQEARFASQKGGKNV